MCKQVTSSWLGEHLPRGKKGREDIPEAGNNETNAERSSEDLAPTGRVVLRQQGFEKVGWDLNQGPLCYSERKVGFLLQDVGSLKGCQEG